MVAWLIGGFLGDLQNLLLIWSVVTFLFAWLFIVDDGEDDGLSAAPTSATGKVRVAGTITARKQS